MRLSRLRLALLAVPAAVLTSPGTLAAEELWSWHAVDFTLRKTPSLEWGLHTRLRTCEGEVQQGRSGTILKVQPRSLRVSLIREVDGLLPTSWVRAAHRSALAAKNRPVTGGFRRTPSPTVDQPILPVRKFGSDILIGPCASLLAS